MIKPRKKYRTNPSLKKRFLYDPCFLPKITPLKKNIAPRAISQAHQLVKHTLRTILMDHIPPTTLERLSHWQLIFLKIYISNWIVYRNKELSIRSKTLAARPLPTLTSWWNPHIEQTWRIPINLDCSSWGAWWKLGGGFSRKQHTPHFI